MDEIAATSILIEFNPQIRHQFTAIGNIMRSVIKSCHNNARPSCCIV